MSRRKNSEPKPILPNSSYYKVLTILGSVPESKEIPEILNHRVRTAKIVGYTFHVNTWNATTTHLFKMRMETDIVEDIPVFVERNISYGSVKEPLKAELKESITPICERIVRTHFGQKDCPTYNCKREKVDLAKYLFDQWYGDGLNENFVNKADDLVAEMARLEQSEEFAKKGRMALSRQAMEEIKASLRKYKEVSEDVVQEAVNEYLCERVVDS